MVKMGRRFSCELGKESIVATSLTEGGSISLLTSSHMHSFYLTPHLYRCGVVRREDLCIAEGRHVWKLNVDIQCLSHEGSLGDACILAAASALADVKLPATAVDKDEEVIILPGEALQFFIVRS